MSEKIPNYNYDADEVLNDFKSKFAWPKRDEVQAVVKPGKMPLRLLLCALITAVVGGIAYYMMLPALNVHDTQLYLFLILLVVVFAGSFFLVCRANKKAERLEYVKKKTLIPVIIVAVIAVVMLVGFLVGATIFRASAYSDLMTVQNSDFDRDFSDISYDEVPRIDASRAKTLQTSSWALCHSTRASMWLRTPPRRSTTGACPAVWQACNMRMYSSGSTIPKTACPRIFSLMW